MRVAQRRLREAGPPRHLLNREVADVLFGQADAHGTTLPNLKRFKSSLKGRGSVNTLTTSRFAGFRRLCRQRRARTGVKTERPQRSEDERS